MFFALGAVALTGCMATEPNGAMPTSLANTRLDLTRISDPERTLTLILRADGTGTNQQDFGLGEGRALPIVWEQRGDQLCLEETDVADRGLDCLTFAVLGGTIMIFAPNGSDGFQGSITPL